MVSLGKLLHETINLLCLPRQPEVKQEHADGIIKLDASEINRVNVCMHHLHDSESAFSEIAPLFWKAALLLIKMIYCLHQLHETSVCCQVSSVGL